jgi:transposase-like protein
MAKTREARRQFWREHVHAWRRSGEGRDDYCREHGLNEQTFNLWVGRLRDELRPGTNGAAHTTDEASPETSAAPTFIPVEIAAEDEAPPTGDETRIAPIEVDAGGVTLRVSATADTDVLARVIAAAPRAA